MPPRNILDFFVIPILCGLSTTLALAFISHYTSILDIPSSELLNKNAICISIFSAPVANYLTYLFIKWTDNGDHNA